jgi:ABC-type multidrug transport system fused ATPase/permease subunit
MFGVIEYWKRIWVICDARERRLSMILLSLFFVQGLLDTVGVASIMPFMAVVGDPSVIESNRFLAAIYDYVGAPGYRAFLAGLGAVAFVMLLVSLGFGAVMQWTMNRYGQVFNLRLSTRLLRSYFSRPYVWYLNHHSVDLGRTVLHEIAGLVNHTLIPTLRILSKSVAIILLLVLVIAVDPVIALVTASVFTSFYALVYYCVRHYLSRLGQEVWSADEERFRIAQEGLGAIKHVKVAGLEAEYLRRFQSPAERLARYLSYHATVGMMPKYFMEAITFGGILLILVALILSREEGLSAVLPLVAVYAFAGYRLMPALQSIYHDVADMKFGTAYLNKLEADLLAGLNADVPVPVPAAVPGALSPRGAIVLDRVCFSYPGAASRALDAISLTIPARRSVAFVGTTGAGKTTVIDLILGLLKPDSGQLIVDGIEITDANRRQWQGALGYVPQEIYLKDDSIAANIAFGVAQADVDRMAVERAARSAELHDFIVGELPNGYDTWIGERGVRLSGGQRQRIGIARALYRDPPVLVFDEATSALDNVTERAVMSAVDQLGRQKTIIIVAHRLSTVRRCDVIYLLERGQLVDSGSFDELSASNARFRAMAAGGV